MTYYGYAGRLLYVDLTTGRYRTEPLDMAVARDFIGGCGIGERLLCDILQPGTDPLSPANPIIITAGPLVGSGVPGAAKIEMLTKSPASARATEKRHYIPRASGGGRRFGVMLKRAGYDVLIITGRASGPVYLGIADANVEVRPASDLWGRKDGYEANDELSLRHPGSGIICIGKAGENQIPMSFAWVDKISHLGRNGGAAVMGAKNLKAIVVHGTGTVAVKNEDRLPKLAAEAIRQAVATPRFQARRSANRNLMVAPEWAPYYPPAMFEDTLIGRTGCHSCVFACKDVHQVKDGEFAGARLESRLLYAMFGPWLALRDYRHAMKLVEVCDRAGVDFLTTITMLRFITRLKERGVLTTRDTDGLELRMGEIGPFLELVEKMVNRDGIGEAMTRGWSALGERVGVDPDTDPDGYQIIKGTTTFFDARVASFSPMAFSQIVNTKPGAELHPFAAMPGVPLDAIKQWCRGIGMSPAEIERCFSATDLNIGRITRHIEDAECVYWAMGTCVTWSSGVPPVYSLDRLAELYSAVTGIDTTARELKSKGEAIWNIGRLLNAREGLSRRDDRLPGLWAKAITEGKLVDYFGRTMTEADFEKMLDDYYDEHGWDISTGNPTAESLSKLKLGKLSHLLNAAA